MTWAISFEAKKGERFHKGFLSVDSGGRSLWWDTRQDKWVEYASLDWHQDNHICNHRSCRSLKAFRRHLRKHPELRGAEVTLVHRYVGFNVSANWMEAA